MPGQSYTKPNHSIHLTIDTLWYSNLYIYDPMWRSWFLVIFKTTPFFNASIKWTTDKPDISLDTSLQNINYGNGLGPEPHSFIIHNASHTTEVKVDLDGAATVGDAINEINAALAAAGIANVTASLNPGSTGINIEDTNIVPLGLSVSEMTNESFAAANLGLLGDISPLLSGTDLNPQPDLSIRCYYGGLYRCYGV